MRLSWIALCLLFSATCLKADDADLPGSVLLMIGGDAGSGADVQAQALARDLKSLEGLELVPVAGGLEAFAREPNALALVPSADLSFTDPPFGYVPIVSTSGFQMSVVAASDTGWRDYIDVIGAHEFGAEITFGVTSPKLRNLAYVLGEATGVDFTFVDFEGEGAMLRAVAIEEIHLGFASGIQYDGVASGTLIDLASAMSAPLIQSPEALTMVDLVVSPTAEGHFVLIGPEDLSDAARGALADAVASVVSDETTETGGLIAERFGGPVVLTGTALEMSLVEEMEAAKELRRLASE